MIPAMFLTQVDHCRAEPSVHRFRYTTLSVLVDVDRLAGMTKSRFFGYNRRAVFAIRDRDYLRGQTGSIKDRLLAYLERGGFGRDWEKIELLTCPRVLGYVFNPVSFFLCYRGGSSRPDLCVAEVNNTFGESHLYIAERCTESGSDRSRMQKFSAPKAFHVSPFYDRSGTYEFFVERREDYVGIRVHLLHQEKTVFTSSVKGEVRPMPGPLLALLRGVRYGWLTFPRIVWQAAALKFGKGLPTYSKPVPNSEWTIGFRAPSLRERIALKMMVRYFRRIAHGELRLELPSGETLEFGKRGGELSGSVRVRDWSVFPRILLGGDVAFGECYTDGLWDSPDVAVLLELFAQNVRFFNDRDIPFTKVWQKINAALHRRRSNSTGGSKRNIAAHYDLGNDLFRRFLDERLVYSCAVFESPGETLEEAQVNKLRKMIAKARIGPGHHVLEIGCGWGAFAIEAVKATGCRVTALTLSEEQLAETRRKVELEGLADRIEVLLVDYREVKGRYDRIVAIEMLEAVGHEHLGLFFRTCDRLLKPDGVVALQFITVSDQIYDSYRKGCDWIQKYIFPGGHCPSLTAVCNAATSESSLLVEEMENIGPSYARTLREWRERFRRNCSELLSLGYDERFQRMWEYYLSYCEAGFASRTLGTLQVVFTRPNNGALGFCPGYRKNEAGPAN